MTEEIVTETIGTNRVISQATNTVTSILIATIADPAQTTSILETIIQEKMTATRDADTDATREIKSIKSPANTIINPADVITVLSLLLLADLVLVQDLQGLTHLTKTIETIGRPLLKIHRPTQVSLSLNSKQRTQRTQTSF